NLARFTRMLQGQRDLLPVSRLILSELAPLVGAHQGAFFLMDSSGGEAKLRMLAGYACEAEDMKGREIPLGEGLVGQCAMEGKGILLEGAPHDYLRVSSGLGSAAPASIVVLPVLFEGEVKAVIELASLGGFNAMH